MVFSFPQQSPKTSVKEGDYGSMEFLEIIDLYNKHWCEHKVSATIHYKQDEFLGIGQWIWDKFDELSGVSFLPYDGHSYQQAPYEAISEQVYNEMVEESVEIDWTQLREYEQEDNTEGTQTLACTGNACEL